MKNTDDIHVAIALILVLLGLLLISGWVAVGWGLLVIGVVYLLLVLFA